jgi:tRNA-dihydrouridine synthase
MYKGKADWSYIAAVKNLPDIHIPIFGNGDVDTPEIALEYKNKYGADGIMIGRAAIGNPWIFNEIKHFFKTGQNLPPPTISERVEVCKKHLTKSIEWKGPKIGIFEMRMHYTNYFKGFPNFKPYRTRLVEAGSYDEVCSILEEVQSVFAVTMVQ